MTATQNMHYAFRQKHTRRGYIAITLGVMAAWGGANAQQPFNFNQNLSVYTRQGETNIQLPGQKPFPIPAGQVPSLRGNLGSTPRLLTTRLPSPSSSLDDRGVGYFKGESAVPLRTVRPKKMPQRFLSRLEDLAISPTNIGVFLNNRGKLPSASNIISNNFTPVASTPALSPATETLTNLAATNSATTTTSGSIGYIAVRAAYTGSSSANAFEITYKEITESTNGAFTLDNFGGTTYESSGLSVGAFSPDNGYSYTSLGSWADGGSFEQKGGGIIGVYATSPNAGTFVLGTATPSADIPSTGNAVYTGNTQGIDNLGVATTGTASLTINFATQNVDAVLTSSHSSGSTLTGNFNNMTISNGHFSAFGGLDSIDGNFYGPAAQEAGGAWQLSNGSGSEQAIGVFRAK